MKKYLSALPIIAVLVFSSTSFVRAQATGSSYQFNQNLTIGSTGPDVIALQQILINKGYLTSVSTPTGYFGSGTRTALEQLQTANNISPASGYCGSITRAFLNSMNVSAPVSQPAPTTSNQENQNSTQNTPTQSVPIPQTYSASALYSELAPQLAFVTCDWYNRYGDVLFSQSSNGILNSYNNSSYAPYFISTVLGGVINTSYTGSVLAPATCDIQFPAGANLYAGGLSTFTVGSYATTAAYGTSPIVANNINIDYAQINIATPNGYLTNYAKKINYCVTRPSVGDSVAVFGWPINSTNQTLTGVITGTSGYYDTTNIGAVPNGMQGSTAVSLTDGCVIGQMNSSGEIADTPALSYMLAI
jgi:peptidoglycan hydrolase-like protein with peptidoglycan-binding domain